MKGPAELPAPHVAVGGVSCEPRPGRVLRKSARQDCPPTLSLFSNELQSEPHSAFWFPGTPWSSRKRRGTRKDRPERQPRKSPPGVQVGLTQCHMAWPEGDELWVWGPAASMEGQCTGWQRRGRTQLPPAIVLRVPQPWGFRLRNFAENCIKSLDLIVTLVLLGDVE